MILAPFNYAAPEGLDEALALLQANEGAQLLAGGQSILTEMRQQHIAPSMLVDLRKIQTLRGIERRSDGVLCVGAMMTFVEISEDKNIQKNYTVLVEAAQSTSDAQVRNCRTIGGTMAFNAPGADLPAVILALEATLTLCSPQGTRTVPASEFNATSMLIEHPNDEIITSINFPPVAAGSGSAYEKFKNQANDYALCGIATSVTLTPEGSISKCLIAVTGATRHAMRLSRVETLLHGQQATAAIIAAASQEAERLNCIADIAASAEYRASLSRTLTERSLTRATARAKEALG
jgi:carbon-monoxide dehydrogenase medium subunit